MRKRSNPFCDRYIKKVQETGVKPPFERWMAVRAEQHIAAHPDQRLAEQSPSQVGAYLAELGRDPKLEGWQLRQSVDAIRILFVLAGVDWLAQVDWQHWRDSARGLGTDRPTVARDYGPVPGAAAGRKPPPRPCAARGECVDRQGSDGDAVDREDASFPEQLALMRKVSASTQNLALNALVFLSREALKREDLDFGDFARAKRPRPLPTVLTHGELTALLGKLSGTHRLMASLMYGTGMRLMECVRLRVQDLDYRAAREAGIAKRTRRGRGPLLRAWERPPGRDESHPRGGRMMTRRLAP